MAANFELCGDFNLSIYDQKPQMEVTFDKFEQIALSRLNMLRWIETQKLQKKQSSFDKGNDLLNVLTQNNLTNNRQYDNLSHFICRLAFTEIKQYSSWFVKHEVTLFELKCKMSSYDKMKEIECKLFNNMTYPLYTANDIILNDLNGRSPIPFFQFNTSLSNVSKTAQQKQAKYFPFHIVPFQDCPNKFIANRLLYIRNGYGFVPHFLFSQIIRDKYSQYLHKKVRQTKYALNKMKQDSEIMFQLSKVMYLIKNLDKISSFQQHININININHCASPSNVNVVNHLNLHKYVNLFPLCMRYSYESLLNNGHLKNNARIQLTLFLKGIGLPLTECLIFFKKHLKQKQANFENHYAYFIRHQYGKAGGSKDYAPFSCSKIILKSKSKISNDDNYGCPFQLFGEHSLKMFVRKYYNLEYNVSKSNYKGNICQLKCKELYGLLNASKLREIEMDIEDIYSCWNHPNKYFDVNHELHRGKETQLKQKYHRAVIHKGASQSASKSHHSHVAIKYNV